MSRLSSVAGIPPATSWEIAQHKGAAEQVFAFALDFDGAVVDHKGSPIKATVDYLGNELPLARTKRQRFLCISEWKSAEVFFTNDAKKIYGAQNEIGTLLTLDLKAYGALLFDRAGKPL